MKAFFLLQYYTKYIDIYKAGRNMLYNSKTKCNMSTNFLMEFIIILYVGDKKL